MKIITTRTYERAIHRLLSERSRREMEVAIAADPMERRLFREPEESVSFVGLYRDVASGVVFGRFTSTIQGQ